jgi:DEAD/DEAH box helicase domain-containing protein
VSSNTLPVFAGDRDGALRDALGLIAPRPLLDRAARSEGSGTALADEAAEPTVTAVHRVAAVAARYATFPEGLDERVLRAYAGRGVTQLYTHQAEAASHALAGRNVVVVTPTASGKTLCYNLPVLHTILQAPSTRALYLFPTKALAQDQLAELHGLADGIEQQAGVALGVFTYDGDTPQDARRAIRQSAHIALTNPDMLHAGILPHHPRWAKLFENLRFIVIDELHAYRGVFGSHLANILRRLRRVCRHYGSDPRFVCSSATIANPRELAEKLTGEPFELVDQSGAPRGEKFFLFVNPPVVNRQLGIRRSYLSETRRVATAFVKRGLQAIVFAPSRLATEILTTYLKDEFEGPPGTPEAVRGYRGGYLPNRRREVERGLREGQVRTVVSTSALELGIDIGALDVAVLAGYPGTIAATWQRAGRAGRRTSRSAAVLVASSAPLDQYVVRHPEYFFEGSPEHGLIDPDNLHILLAHVKCGAFELPFAVGESFGEVPLDAVLEMLEDSRLVHRAGDQWHWTDVSYPADAISLRAVSSDNFVVVDETAEPRIIAETDYTSAPFMLHPKAIYILEGAQYQVERLDWDGRKAYVRAVDTDYFTDAISYTKVTPLDEFARTGALAAAPPEGTGGDRVPGAASEGGAIAALDETPAPAGLVPATHAHGEVHVVSRIVGFKKIKFYTNENVGSGELDLPEQQMHTTAYWVTVAPEVMAALPFDPQDRRDGVSGMAHAMVTVAQLLLMCDRRDLGVSVDGGTPGREFGGQRRTNEALGASALVSSEEYVAGRGTLEPRVFLYDNYPGGIGFSKPLHDLRGELLRRTRELVRECPCESGCPSCVGPLGEVGPLAKTVALRLLTRLMA